MGNIPDGLCGRQLISPTKGSEPFYSVLAVDTRVVIQSNVCELGTHDFRTTPKPHNDRIHRVVASAAPALAAGAKA